MRDYTSGSQNGRLRNRTHRWQMVKVDGNGEIPEFNRQRKFRPAPIGLDLPMAQKVQVRRPGTPKRSLRS